MAIVERITFHASHIKEGTMRVDVKLHPRGETMVVVPLPEDLFNAVMKLAQTAADQDEAQMHAQLLGEKYTEIESLESAFLRSNP